MEKPFRAWVVAAAVCGAAASLAAREGPGPSPAEATVLVTAQVSPPDFISPWQRAEVEEYSGSGAIIEGGRVLTNAHLVANHVMVEVRRQGMTRRFDARVEHVCHPCDLALLAVDDEAFFEAVEPLKVGPLPGLREQVQVYGFPVGGESISVTSGVVSRIEVGLYVHSFDELLLVQIDAALNRGNSGGPAVSDGLLVGVASQTFEEGENIGYVIPTPIVRHFLEDVEDGAFDGFPRLGVDLQAVESPALRASLGMAGETTGALVRRVNYGSPAWGVLEAGDVLLAIDGARIAEDLTVALDGGLRVQATHLVRAHQMGEKVSLSVLREGRPLALEAELRPWRMLVPPFRHERWPSYFVFGGLVFQPLVFEYLSLYDEFPPNLAPYVREWNLVTQDRREVVVISSILKHPVNKGYEGLEDLVVESAESRRLRDMRHLVEMVEGAVGPWLELRATDGTRIVLDLEAARKAGPQVLALHGIPADRSPDLRK